MRQVDYKLQASLANTERELKKREKEGGKRVGKDKKVEIGKGGEGYENKSIQGTLYTLMVATFSTIFYIN